MWALTVAGHLYYTSRIQPGLPFSPITSSPPCTLSTNGIALVSDKQKQAELFKTITSTCALRLSLYKCPVTLLGHQIPSPLIYLTQFFLHLLQRSVSPFSTGSVLSAYKLAIFFSHLKNKARSSGHTCNPTSLGGRRIVSSKPALAT